MGAWIEEYGNNLKNLEMMIFQRGIEANINNDNFLTRMQHTITKISSISIPERELGNSREKKEAPPEKLFHHNTCANHVKSGPHPPIHSEDQSTRTGNRQRLNRKHSRTIPVHTISLLFLGIRPVQNNHPSHSKQ